LLQRFPSSILQFRPIRSSAPLLRALRPNKPARSTNSASTSPHSPHWPSHLRGSHPFLPRLSARPPLPITSPSRRPHVRLRRLQRRGGLGLRRRVL
jgi:hypothetical protein